jgi:hypothetical protein
MQRGRESQVRYRRFLLVSLVLGAAFGINAVPGCGALQPEPDGWKSQPTHNALPAVFRVSSLDEIRRCTGRADSIGCALRDYKRGFCYVLVPADAPKWLLGHEMLHCAGFDHE